MDKFKRTEKKYLLSAQIFEKLLQDILPYLKEDQYPHYTIYNIYLDAKDSKLIYRSLEKPIYKEKMRLRSYGPANSSSPIFLEMKKKWEGIVYKRRITLTIEQVRKYLIDDIRPPANNQILAEIDYMKHFYDLKPSVVLYYERWAYTGFEDTSLRITFDTNIRYRFHSFSLSGLPEDNYLINQNNYLMEIKVSQGMTLWLTAALSRYHIYPTSFSKYGQIYQKEKERLSYV